MLRGCLASSYYSKKAQSYCICHLRVGVLDVLGLLKWHQKPNLKQMNPHFIPL